MHTVHFHRVCKGTRVGPYDFRNESLVQFFINDYIGGPDCVGNPDVDGACVGGTLSSPDGGLVPAADAPPSLADFEWDVAGIEWSNSRGAVQELNAPVVESEA